MTNVKQISPEERIIFQSNTGTKTPSDSNCVWNLWGTETGKLSRVWKVEDV